MNADDRHERGQTAVEMALMMPFLLMFILFLVDLALLGFSYVSVTNAVREGARCGAVGASDAAIQTRVENTSGAVEVSVGSIVRGGNVGDDITVSADVQYNWLTPVGLVPGLSGSLNFTKASIMRMEMSGPPYEGSCGGGT